MLLLSLILLPFAGAAAAALMPARRTRLALMIGIATVHLAGSLLSWRGPARTAAGGWLRADPLGLMVLTLVSVLFLITAHHAAGSIRATLPRGGRLFATCMLSFLGAMSLVTLSQHVALMWIGMEGTTLACAPLIYNEQDRRSLEAVWKYLVLSSVGIALALVAVFLLATAQPAAAGVRPLVLDDLVRQAAAGALDPRWLRAAFVFALVGFGTKMGLAPLHTWKPDTYGEAPGIVSGLMAGALTSCAFVAVARFTGVLAAAGLAGFAGPLLIAFGILSLVVAAAFVIGQADVKRLLAYSSVEQMGLLVLGLGIGGVGTYGALLQMLNNGLAKVLLFLVVGNLALATGSSLASDMRGMLRARPAWAMLLLAGLFALTGSPPFGMFVSELTIVSGAIREHHAWLAALIIVLLAVIFTGIARMILEIVYGEPAAVTALERAPRDGRWLLAGPMTLAALLLMLGVYIPLPLRDALGRAADALGGMAP